MSRSTAHYCKLALFINLLGVWGLLAQPPNQFDALSHWVSPGIKQGEQFLNVRQIGTKLIAVGENGEFYQSLEGLNWRQIFLHLKQDLYDVVHFKEQTIVVGQDGLIVNLTKGSTNTLAGT